MYNMTYNEKKSLYESIMKVVAKTVKRQINEAGVAPLTPISKSVSLKSFRQLYKIMSNYSSPSNQYGREGFYVESSDEDIQFAAMAVILKALKNFKVYHMSVAGMDANDFRNLNFNDLNKYDFIIIDDLSYAQKSAIPALLNLVDGGINDKKFLPKVIIMSCDSVYLKKEKENDYKIVLFIIF